MKITQDMLVKMGACKEGVDWFEKQSNHTLIALAKAAINGNKFQYANWAIVRLMSHKQKVKYALFAAEQVLDIFEKKYPEDDRPRKAIEAAKAWLKNPCKETADAAANAADAAADAAANAADAAANAAYAAANAAYAAAYAAYVANAAAYAAANAAYAAAYAAYVANAAAYAAKLKKKIILYGVKLLKEVK